MCLESSHYSTFNIVLNNFSQTWLEVVPSAVSFDKRKQVTSRIVVNAAAMFPSRASSILGISIWIAKLEYVTL